MDLGDHGGNPAHVEVLAPNTLATRQAFLHVAAHRWLPEAQVGDIDGEFAGLGGDLNVGMGQDELADVLVQGEAVDAVTRGKHHHGRGPVDGVAGGYLAGARLEEGLLAGLIAIAGTTQDREDGPHRDIDIDVRGAIQGIEGQQVLAARIARRDGVDIIHLFRGHGRQVTRPFVRLDENLIGEDVQLFLGLALNILAPGAAQDPHQGAMVDHVRDDLAGGNDIVEQGGEIPRGTRDVTLLLNDELGDSGTVVHALPPVVASPKAGCEIY